MFSDFDILDTIIGYCIDNHINSFAELCCYCRTYRMDWFKFVVMYPNFFVHFLNDYWSRYLACSVEVDSAFEDLK